MKTSELRALSQQELREALTRARQQQFVMRMKSGSGQPVKPHEFQVTRKLIARIKTVMTEKVGNHE